MAIPRLLAVICNILAMHAAAAQTTEPESESAAKAAARILESAIELTPDPERGRAVYMTCAVCHGPEGWETADGEYPQIAGQLYPVLIKQLADIRARNRDTPTMLPFTMSDVISLQQIADVCAYVSRLPMNPDNSLGPGTNLETGERLYREHCVDCHGADGEGIADEYMPLIQGQNYSYLVRQFKWIAAGRRRNADAEMIEQIKNFSEEEISAIMDYTSRLSPPPERLAQPGWRNPDFSEFADIRRVRTYSDETQAGDRP